MVKEAVQATRLDAQVVYDTGVRLQARIRARFPTRDLGRVAGEMVELVDEIRADSASEKWIRVLKRVCQMLIGVLLVSVPLALSWAIVQGTRQVERTTDWISIFESAVNDLVFTGIAVLFLWAVPDRLARAGALRILHRLRSLAHVIDMHQLTKDPERYRPDFQPTDESVVVDLSARELSHYLDYCSELLSLVGKAAALFANETTDRVVLSSVHDIETLATNLSRQIWQKISLLPGLGVNLVPAIAPTDGRDHEGA